MADFEPLRPRPLDPLSQDTTPDQPIFSPLSPSSGAPNPYSEQKPEAPRDPFGGLAGTTWEFGRDLDDDDEDDLDQVQPVDLKSRFAETEGSPSSRSAFQNIGVNLSSDTPDTDDPVFSNKVGFYETDFDFSGERAARRGLTGVQAANVFGIQYTRAQLEKDDEGRRLLALMEAERSGEYKNEGFWSGLTSFSDLSGSYKKVLADIPFLGWMIDGGATVSETIDMSKAMRKLQNHEEVSDHELFAVRRFMLQQQMESQRKIGYQAGSVVHSSIPFMFEMAASGAALAAGLKLGAAVAAMGGPAGWIGGGLITLGSGLLFGGAMLGKGIGKLLGKGTAKTAEMAGTKVLKDLAARTAKDGFTRAELAAIQTGASEALGLSKKEAVKRSRAFAAETVSVAMGRELAEKTLPGGAEAAKSLTDAQAKQFLRSHLTKDVQKELSRRQTFEAHRLMAENGAKAFLPENMDAKLAVKFMLGGDLENSLRAGFSDYVENAALRKVYPVLTDAPKGYFARRKAYQAGLKQLLADDANWLAKARKDFAAGMRSAIQGDEIGSIADIADQPLTKVIGSLSSSVGDDVIVHNGFARQVLDHVLDTEARSLSLKYGVGSAAGHGAFVNSMERFGQWFADGALNGMFRWDTSMFGGLGTIARSETALGSSVRVLQEALKASFIEAPVRGAMQLGMQAPLWPVAAGLTGNNPMDFVVKGQLGIQAQALQTGDRALMDHARAIAIGSGVVEYISENAGRGINMMLGGLVKPAALEFLPGPVKELGSSLSRKVTAVFGTERDMVTKNADMLAEACARRLGTMAANSGAPAPSVTMTDLVKMVKSGSAKDIPGLASALASFGISEKELIKGAINQTITHNKVKAGCLYFTAYTMMKNGLTPQKFAEVLHRVGYDGIVSEMLEERYGGFFQGLLGLNERPSNEGFKGRLEAAFEGLFPDKDQLITEAIGFAVPGVAHMAFNRMYSGLAQGAVAQFRQDVDTLDIGMNDRTELNLPLASPEYVQAVNTWRASRRSAFSEKFGDADAARKSIVDKAQDVLDRIKNKKFVTNRHTKQLTEITDVEEAKKYLSELVDRVVDNAKTEEEFNSWVDELNLKEMIGEDGVASLLSVARHNDEFTDQAKTDYFESAEYKALRDAAPLPSEAASSGDLDDVVNRITMAVPVLAADQSALADIRLRAAGNAAHREAARANQYRNNLLDTVTAAASRIADTYFRSKFHATDPAVSGGTTKNRFVSMLTRGAARLVGTMDAIITGDLSLASRNPVQWALASSSLDKGFGSDLLAMKVASVRTGMQKVLSQNREALIRVMGKESKAVEGLLKRIDEYTGMIESEQDAAVRSAAKSERDRAITELNEKLEQFSAEYSESAFEGLDSELMDQFVAAGAEDFNNRLRPFMSAYLTAKNVLDVSRSDLSVAARQLANERAQKSGNAVTADDIELAERQIVQRLVQMASDNIIRVNTNATFSVTNSTAVAIDLERAMSSGTEPEILAAVQSLPAFASVPAVHNLSGGNLLDEQTVRAFGRTIELSDIADMPYDGDLTPGQVAKIMGVTGGKYAYKSDAECQAMAKRFLRQVRTIIDNTFPIGHTEAGKPVTVTYERRPATEDRPSEIVATVWNADGTQRASYSAASMSALVRDLAAVGIRATLRQVVFAKNSRLVSNDATSVVLSCMSREDARNYFVSEGVANEDLPPYLRRKFDKDIGTTVWEFSDEDAMAEMRRELREGSKLDDDSPGADVLRARVYHKADGTPGYEEISQKFLESLGHRKHPASGAISALGIGRDVWVVSPSSLNFGPRMYVTSDYFSSGDSEAMLRVTINSALDNMFRNPSGFGGMTHAEISELFATAEKLFDSTVDSMCSNWEAGKPEYAERLRRLQQTLRGQTPGRVSLDKLSAMVASVALFTSDRGLGEAGNGFLLSPELAFVANGLRTMPQIVPFLSLVDRALGGTGAFSGAAESFSALRELAAAFSPSGDAIFKSRATSMFVADEADPTITYPVLTKGQLVLDEHGRVVLNTGAVRYENLRQVNGDRRFNGPFTVFDGMAAPCEELRAEYVNNNCGPFLTEADVNRMLVRADADGGVTVTPDYGIRASVALGRTAGSRGGRRLAGGVVSQEPVEAARTTTSEVISEVNAVMLGRNLSFLIPRESSDAEVDSMRKADWTAAMRGELSETDARAVAADAVFQANVVDFLRSRGMDQTSIDVVMRMLPVALGGRTEEVALDVTPEDAAAEDTGEEQDELNDAVDEGANLESWHDAKKVNDATGNKDLIEIGEWMMHLFPREKRNHMAVFSRVYSELMMVLDSGELDEYEASADAEGKRQAANFRKVVRSLNALRARGEETATEAIANVERFEDETLTQYRLTNAVDFLNRVLSRPDLAAVLNALRRIKVPQRRSKALENIAYFSRVDGAAAYVNIVDGAPDTSVGTIGSSATGCEDSVRAALCHFVLAHKASLETVDDAEQWLDDMQSLVRQFAKGSNDGFGLLDENIMSKLADTEGEYAFTSLMSGLLGTEVAMLREPGKTYDTIGFKSMPAAWGKNKEFKAPTHLTPAQHAAIVTFAECFTSRMYRLSNAVEALAGSGNELTSALRNPEMTRIVVELITDEMLTPISADRPETEADWKLTRARHLQNVFGDMYSRSFPQATKLGGNTTLYSASPLLEELLFAPVNHAMRFAAIDDRTDENGAPLPMHQKVAEYLSGSALVPLMTRGRLTTPSNTKIHLGPVRLPSEDELEAKRRWNELMAEYGNSYGAAKDAAEALNIEVWRTPDNYSGDLAPLTWSIGPGRSWSPYGNLFRWMEAGAARSTIRVSGKTKSQFRDSGQANGCPASAPVFQSRFEESCLSMIPAITHEGPVDGAASLRDLYMDNGQKFSDGSRLVATFAGAAVGNVIQDGASVPRIVFHAAVDKFVTRADTSRFLFQLYHGEKPTVNCLQLPGYVCEQIYSDILSGAEYTQNEITESLRDSLAKSALSEIDDPAGRRLAYDALFAVVSKHSGCNEIDPKRVQVLLSQGTPFAGHRDYYSTIETVDGVDTEVVHRWEDVRSGKDGDGEPVVPGTRFIMDISGASATANMGMYYGHGRLIEAQRSISTNPQAVSFKNHLTDWSGVALTKGQCHDIMIGLDEDEETQVTGVGRRAQESMRRELERALGLPSGSLDRLDKATMDLAAAGDVAAQKRVDERNGYVARAKEFLKFSSLVSTDLETQKAGPFGNRAGFAAESESDTVTIEITGKQFMFSVRKDESGAKRPMVSVDGGTTWTAAPRTVPAPKFKNGAWPLATMIPLAMETLGIDELSESDVAGIVSSYRTADGASQTRVKLSASGIFRGMGEKMGDALSFAKTGKSYQARYFTRSTIGQIMANADAKSKASNDHPAATNYVRDLVSNQAYRYMVDPSTSAAAIATVCRAVPQAIFRAFPGTVDEYVFSDPMFAVKAEQNPLSESVMTQVTRKRNAAFAKAMRVYPSATHAVLLGSGRMAKDAVDTVNHLVGGMDESDGVTDYDRDATRPAHIVKSVTANALRRLYGSKTPFGDKMYAVDRTYSSGLVNVDISEAGDPAFRYAWHLDEEALDALGSPTDVTSTLYRSLSGWLTHRNVVDQKDPATGAPTLQHHETVLEVVRRYMSVLAEAYPSESRQELQKVAVVAGIIYGARFGNKDCMNLCGSIFTDYTGMSLADSPACNLDAVGLTDLFIEDEVDLLALGFGKFRKLNGSGEDAKRTITVGGSFFSGDRRPSGNYEAAGGLARASAPVTMKPDMTPGKTAMYILDPVQCTVQGSDTDGDSATLIKMSGHMPTKADEKFVSAVFEFFRDASIDATDSDNPRRKLKFDGDTAMTFCRTFATDPAFQKYFKVTYGEAGPDGKPAIKSVDVTPKYQETLGNLLFKTQIDNYRMLEARELSPAAGSVARTGCEIADATDDVVYDVGFSGRSPVGPDVVSGAKVPLDDMSTRNLYRRVVGEDMPADMPYNKAFSACIDAISKKAGITVDVRLLDAETSAFLSASAADASGARGVMVALQAAIGHLNGLSWEKDDKLKDLCPALYDEYLNSDGRVIYDPCREFVAHLDGISNSLFDVVKDLFAPRAGWQKNMLNYLVSSLLHDANSTYRAVGTRARFNDAWFFGRLVRYAEDFMLNEDSIAGLLKKANEGNNYLFSEKFGTKAPVLTMRGMVRKASEKDSGTVLEFLGSFSHAKYGRFRKYTNLAEGIRLEVDNVTGDFESVYGGWTRDLYGAFLNAEFRDGLRNRAANSKLPDGVQAAFDDYADQNSNGTPEGRIRAYVDFIDDIAETIKMVGPGSVEGSAVLSHLLFGSTDQFAERYARVKSAAAGLSRLSDLTTANAAVSPEKTFQQSGIKAVSTENKIGRSAEMASESNDMFNVQAFVNGNRIVEQARTEFDPELVSEATKATVRGFDDAVTTPTKLAAMLKNSGLAPVRMTETEMRSLAAALMHSNEWQATGVVDGNRRRLGAMLAAVEKGIEVSRRFTNGDEELAKKRFAIMCAEYLDTFSCGTEAASRLRAQRKKAAAKDSGDEDVETMVNEEFRDRLDRRSDRVDDSIKAPKSRGSSVLGGLVLRAFADLSGDDASFFLQHINVTEGNGRIALESKLGPYGAAMARNGFHQMLADTATVVVPGAIRTSGGTYDLTMADVAVMMWLRLASATEFDSVRESDTKVDMTNLFTPAELNRMDRYAVAANHTLTGRALACVNQDANGSYDLLRVPAYFDGPPSGKVFSKFLTAAMTLDPAAATSGLAKYKNPTSCATWLASVKATFDASYGKVAAFSPVNIMANMVTYNGSFRTAVSAFEKYEADVRQRHRREDLQIQNVETRVVSTYATKPITDSTYEMLDALDDKYAPTTAPFKFLDSDGEEVDSLEEAVNSYAESAADDITGRIADSADRFSDQDEFNYLVYRTYTKFRAAREVVNGDGELVDNTVSLDYTIRTVLADTRKRVGDRDFGRWCKQALARGGKFALSPTAHPTIRGELNRVLDEMNADAQAAAETKAKVVVDLAPPVSARMTRAGFSQLMANKPGDHVANTYEGIKFAYETAFGRSDGKGPGVAVTQLKRNGIPMSVVRIDRYMYARVNGAKDLVKVTTYVSYGEALDMEHNEAYLESLLEALNDGAKVPMTMDQLKSLTAAQLELLVKSTGARVNGLSESKSRLTTQALLALTGLVRIGNGADYSTLFHEYFHQMLGFCRETGLLTQEDEQELLSRYHDASGKRFNEEEAANAFAEYVVGRTEAATRLVSKGMGVDPDGKSREKDELFGKFYMTAQVLLAGGATFDANGMPVFMRMVITGDFSDVEMTRVESLGAKERKALENKILEDTVDMDISEEPAGPRRDYVPGTGAVPEAEADVLLAVKDVTSGNAPFSRLAIALGAREDAGRQPGAEPTFEPTMAPFGVDLGAEEPADDQTATEPHGEAKLKPVSRAPAILDPKTPRGVRLQLLLDEAMKSFGNRDGLTAEERRAIELLYHRVNNKGDVSYDQYDLLVGTAARILRETCQMLGIRYDAFVRDWIGEGFNPAVGVLTVKTSEQPSFGCVVNFTEMDHRYWSEWNGAELVYTSGTAFHGAFSADFKKSRAYAKAKPDVRRAWESTGAAASAFGTLIHTVYEDVFSGSPIRAVGRNAREVEAIKRAAQIAAELKKSYDFVGAEVIVADPNLKIAGSIDLIVRSKATGDLVIIDHKTNQFIGRKAFNGAKMKGCLSHLLDSQFNHYALQVNLYRELLRRSGKFGITKDTKISFMINHFPGHDASSFSTAYSKALLRGENAPAVVSEYEVIADEETAKTMPAGLRKYLSEDRIPDLSKEIAAMFDHAKGHPEVMVKSGGKDGSHEVPLRTGDANLVAELAVRMARAVIGNTVATDDAGLPVKSDMRAPGMYEKVDYALATGLAGVAYDGWGHVVLQMKADAQARLLSAEDDLRKRAELLGGNEALEARADFLAGVSERLNMAVNCLVNGANLARMLPADVVSEGASLYDSLFRHVVGGARAVLSNDGLVRYESDDASLDMNDKDVESAVDLVAKVLGVGVSVNKFIEENGFGPVAPGGSGAIPPNLTNLKPVRPEPAAIPKFTVTVDTTPQMILQSQTSWMASDLMKGFYGINLRDMMTDTSLQAVAEETNRIANRIDFYIGADVGPGGRLREITGVTSKLGRSSDGMFEWADGHGHYSYRAAPVRGYFLGLVTRAAKTVGPALTLDDVNMINVAGQMIGVLANGETELVTGLDVSADQYERLALVTGGSSVADLVTGSPTGDSPHSGFYSVTNVINRVKAKAQGEARGMDRATNLDILLERLATSYPSAITGCEVDPKTGRLTGAVRPDGLYCKLLSVYRESILMLRPNGRTRKLAPTSSEIKQRVVQILTDQGLAVTSAGDMGKTVITIPFDRIDDAWNKRGSGDSRTTMDKLVEAGRRQTFLDLPYLATMVKTDAMRINKAANRTRFMRDGIGRSVAGTSEAGLWFDAGSGRHGLIVQSYMSAREALGGTPSSDEVLYNKFGAFMETLSHEKTPALSVGGANARRKLGGDNTLGFLGDNVEEASRVTGNDGQAGKAAVVKALERAFMKDSDGRLVFLRNNKIQLLMKLLGLGKRVDDQTSVDEFVSAVENGEYSARNPDNRFGVDLDKDMTVAELDRQLFELSAANMLTERLNGGNGNTVFTRPPSEGGFGFSKQDLIDLNEVLRRMSAKSLVDSSNLSKVNGNMYTISDRMAFISSGQLPGAKTGTERLRSMAESIVHAERFRGCLTQMLTTVGSDGMPNYIVDPSNDCEQLAPDPFWGALAKFVGTKIGAKLGHQFKYDDTMSGRDNMHELASLIREAVAKEKKTPADKRTFRYRSVPPDSFGGESLFDNVLCLGDAADDDESILNAVVGGEAEGYLKQLFSVVSSPSIWHGWQIVDRMMSYSKAASVGMSAFFAFATRFESATAACGLLNAAGGQTAATSKLLRALENTSFGKAFSGVMANMGLEGLDSKMPLMSDFMQVVTSDDPMIRDMRELCHLVGVPLSDAIRNPMNDAGGYIDQDIKRIKRMLEAGGHHKWAKEVDGVLKAALQNPGEYAFANVLNCVQMAVVAQTMYRLRNECLNSERPFDVVAELRKIAPYISTEVGGIRPERYAWLTPGMQKVLRMTMFSWQWTMSAWTAGSGEVISDLLFGGHSTTKAMRQYAFIRWMRMLGMVKVGVPVVLQMAIRGLATIIQRLGLVGNPDDPDDKDPLGIEKMPWLCFNNESHIGAFAFDVTPILKLCGRLRKGADDMAKKSGYRDYIAPAVPWITTVGGGLAGAAMTKSIGGGIIGSAVGGSLDMLLPRYDGVGGTVNTSGRRRYYMHFGKQSDEFWRWFTDAWTQATSKLSIPLQKTVEAFFGSTNGSNFNKAFHDRPLLERFFHTASLSPNDNAIVNFFTAFTPFSFASIAQHPDAGVLGMFAPIKMGTSETAAQKRIVARLKAFADPDLVSAPDVRESARNKTNLKALCSDILYEASLNGMNPDEVLRSGLATATHDLYRQLFSCLPKKEGDTVDGRRVGKILRALYKLNRRTQAMTQSLKKQYAAANVDFRDVHNRGIRRGVLNLLRKSTKNPWFDDDLPEKLFRSVFEDADKATRQADKGGENFGNFLATDKVPASLFGIPIVEANERDREFFRRNPEAGGFYDLGDEPPPDEPPPDQGGRAAAKGGTAMDRYFSALKAYRKNGKTGQRGSFDAVVDTHRAAFPKSRLFDYRVDAAGRRRYSNPDQVTLLMQVLGDPESAASTDAMMKYFYGDDASSISESVIEKRLRRGHGQRTAGKNDVAHVSGAFTDPDRTSATTYSIRAADPMKTVTTTVDLDGKSPAWKRYFSETEKRGGHMATTQDTHLPVSATNRSALEAAFHEVLGHGFNPIREQNSAPNDPCKSELLKRAFNGRSLYYTMNDDELAAELGNFRKLVYRNLSWSDNTPVDAGTPEGFREAFSMYTRNKDAFGFLPGTTRKMLDELQFLEEYDPDRRPDHTEEQRRTITDRRDHIRRVLADADLIGQVADVRHNETDMSNV